MLALIPARGGSKGLPGKNIKVFCGKPLIAYAIEAAIKSTKIKEVIVSTDDDAIAKVSVDYGATVPFLRPAELASDSALAVDNYIYTINRLNSNKDEKIKEFTVLQPTSPLRNASDIDNAIDIFEQKRADSVVSYTREIHPIVWHKYLKNDDSFENIFEESINNRQDCRPSFFPNGAVFVFNYNMILKRMLYTENSFAYVMPRNRSVDIDNLEDFEYAEFLLNRG